MVILEWVLWIGLGGLVSYWCINTAQTNQQRSRLEQAFYRLLESENGCISLIQLAVAAKVDAVTARQYLDAQATAFAAIPEVDADGDTFYRFPKLRRSPEGDARPDDG